MSGETLNNHKRQYNGILSSRASPIAFRRFPAKARRGILTGMRDNNMNKIRLALTHVGFILAAFLITFLTRFIPVYKGPEDSTVGQSQFWGLPIPFFQTAPGFSWGKWSGAYFISVVIIFGVIEVTAYLRGRQNNMIKSKIKWIMAGLVMLLLVAIVALQAQTVPQSHGGISPDGRFRCLVQQKTDWLFREHYETIVTIDRITAARNWKTQKVSRISQDSLGMDYYSINWTYDETNRTDALLIWGGRWATDDREIVYKEVMR